MRFSIIAALSSGRRGIGDQVGVESLLARRRRLAGPAAPTTRSEAAASKGDRNLADELRWPHRATWLHDEAQR